MLFAAGKGTRLKPLTDVIPKALVPVGDKPLLQIVAERLVQAGATKIVVNVHHHAGQVKNMVSLLNAVYPCSMMVSDETEQLLETGGGVKKARKLFDENEPVLIHNCDILSNLDLKAIYEQSKTSGNAATLVVSERKTQRYLLFSENMRLVGWTNITTGEVKSPYPEVKALDGYTDVSVITDSALRMFAFSGIHAMSPAMFPLMDEWPDRFPIMDFYLRYCAEHDIRGIFRSDLKLLDVGKLDTLASAEDFLKTF